MLHEFRSNECIHCGISIAVSGYSEPCPARANGPMPPMRSQPVRPEPAVRSPLEGRCYRCQNLIIPKITQQNIVRGGIAVPVGNNAVLIPSQEMKYAAECPICGVPLNCPEVERMNQEISEKNTSTAVFILVILGALALLAVLVNAL